MRRAILVALVAIGALIPTTAHAETWQSWKAEHGFWLKPLVLPAEITPADARFLIHEYNVRLKAGLHRRWKAYKKANPTVQVAISHSPIPPYTGDHLSLWLCIHSLEGSWTDPNPPYFGGLQMGYGFMEAYGGSLYAEKGTADHWTSDEQIGVAENAWAINGYNMRWLFSQWPISGPACS